MAKQTINNGTIAGDGTGEVLFTAFKKTNENFTELYNSTDIVINSTLTTLTAIDLNTAYPTALKGFRVVADSITLGAEMYTKTATGWVSNLITVL